MPTVLEMMGLPNHPGFQGQSVLKHPLPGRNLYITSQGVIPTNGVIQYPWKYIERRNKAPILLNTEENPLEDNNILHQETQKGAELKAALNNYIEKQMNYYNSLERLDHYAPQYEN